MKKPTETAHALVNDFNHNTVPWMKGSLELAVGIRIALEEAYAEGFKDGKNLNAVEH